MVTATVVGFESIEAETDGLPSPFVSRAYSVGRVLSASQRTRPDGVADVKHACAAADDGRMPPKTSLALVLYFSLLVGVNLVIVIPTADDYAHRLGGDELFGGLLIGAFPLSAIFGMCLTNLGFRRRAVTLKATLLLLCLGTILGNLLYALAGLTHAKWTILIARCILGVCNGFNLPTLYIGITVGLHRRSEILFYWSALVSFGYALGPALAALLEVFVKSVRIDNLVLDSDTVPGWFMTVLYVLLMAKIILFFEDLPLEATAPKDRPINTPIVERFPVFGSCAVFLYLCVTSIVLTAAEVYAVNVGQNSWGWSITSSALFLAGLMTCTGISNLAMGSVIARFVRSDRAGLLCGIALACVACIPLFNFDLHAVSAQASLLGVALVFVLTIVGALRALALAVSSKLVPPHMKSMMNTFAVMGMLLGRGVGGIVGAILDPTSFAPALLGMFILTGLVGAACHSCMVPHEKAE